MCTQCGTNDYLKVLEVLNITLYNFFLFENNIYFLSWGILIFLNNIFMLFNILNFFLLNFNIIISLVKYKNCESEEYRNREIVKFRSVNLIYIN